MEIEVIEPVRHLSTCSDFVPDYYLNLQPQNFFFCEILLSNNPPEVKRYIRKYSYILYVTSFVDVRRFD